jgi:hypothetical protein
MNSKTPFWSYAVIAILLVAVVAMSADLSRNNVFRLQLTDSGGNATKVFFVKHFSDVSGKHSYVLSQWYRSEYVYGPSADSVAWTSISEERIDSNGVTAMGEGCSVALRFDGKGSLIGIGRADADGIGPVQDFSAIPLKPGLVYRVADHDHLHGGCVFRTNRDATEVEFAVLVLAPSLQLHIQ